MCEHLHRQLGLWQYCTTSQETSLISGDNACLTIDIVTGYNTLHNFVRIQVVFILKHVAGDKLGNDDMRWAPLVCQLPLCVSGFISFCKVLKRQINFIFVFFSYLPNAVVFHLKILNVCGTCFFMHGSYSVHSKL